MAEIRECVCVYDSEVLKIFGLPMLRLPHAFWLANALVVSSLGAPQHLTSYLYFLQTPAFYLRKGAIPERRTSNVCGFIVWEQVRKCD